MNVIVGTVGNIAERQAKWMAKENKERLVMTTEKDYYYVLRSVGMGVVASESDDSFTAVWALVEKKRSHKALDDAGAVKLVEEPVQWLNKAAKLRSHQSAPICIVELQLQLNEN